MYGSTCQLSRSIEALNIIEMTIKTSHEEPKENILLNRWGNTSARRGDRFVCYTFVAEVLMRCLGSPVNSLVPETKHANTVDGVALIE